MPLDSVSASDGSVLKPAAMSDAPLKSDFLRVLTERGYVHLCTDLEALDGAAAAGPITAYIGFDATADSLHVGSLVQIMMLRRLQQTGHKPIVVMGGGTTKVGAPSGKDESRKHLPPEIIASNMASIRRAFTRFLDFEGERAAIMVDNAEWLDRLAYIDFLREYGPHFTINRMLTFDSVKLRLEREQPLTFLEFNYMLMQAVDYLELERRHGCVLQMGGSDQWGNIVNGVDLGRRMGTHQLFALTCPLLSEEQIQDNIARIKGVFERFLTFGDGPTDAVMVDNDTWLSKFGYVEFLRDFGVHFTINRMLAFDSVKARLEREQPMTFLEFNYMLMQSVDFLELERRLGCVLQMGGSDQWGNIVNGVELIRRVDQQPAFGLTTPLLSTASGAKMGKTVGGAVWLNADMRSPYDYWQFWRNTEDADVGRFLRLFTELPLDEIALLEALPGAQINDAKKVLANTATAMLHGKEEAAKAAAAAEAAFEQGRLSDDLPTYEAPAAELSAGISLAALAADAGLAASRGEARRLAQGGGLRLNDKPEPDANRMVTDADLVDGVVKLAAGKKKIVLVKPV